MHSQTAAPGYAMCYAWGIRHIDGDPWKKTRIDEEIHEWLWADDAKVWEPKDRVPPSALPLQIHSDNYNSDVNFY